MPPPPSSDSAPADAFPSLPLTRRILPAQTYASVVRARPERGNESGWGPEDVDRQDELDELIVGGAAPSSPPWRRRGRGFTPPSNANAATAGFASGGGPSRDRAEDRIRPAPEGRMVTRDVDGLITLEQLLGVANNGNTSPNPAPPPPVAQNQPSRPSSRAGRDTYSSIFAEEHSWNDIADPTEQAWRTWGSGISAARRSGYAGGPGDSRSADSASRTLRGDLVAARAERAASDNPDDTQGRYLPTLRRRQRIPIGPITRVGQEDDGTASEIRAWNEAADALSDADEEEWRRQTLYSQPNVTGDDVDGWGSTLSRGGNNRRRRSLLQRLQTSASVEEIHVDLHGQPAGLLPTNLNISQASSPMVVRSAGARRPLSENAPRVANTIIQDTSGADGPVKKRRKLNPAATPFTPSSPPFLRPTYLSYTALTNSTPLPRAFATPHRTSHLALSSITRQNNSYPVITFTLHPLPVGNDADASALRTTTAIPFNCGVHYYEAEVLDQGAEGYMSVGWMSENSDLGRLVGWDKGSWGWHADDGRSFEGQPRGESFAEKWGTGDVVGCGVDFTTGRAFFTKNGRMIGHRFSKLSRGLYPAVGLRTPRESVLANFNGPFVFDIDKHVRDIRDRVWREVTAPKDDLSSDEGHVIMLVDQMPKEETKKALPLTDEDVPEVFRLNGEEIDVVLPEEQTPNRNDAKLPPLSPLQDSNAKTAAAFALDYLQHNGHATAHELVLASMSKRGWVPSVAWAALRPATPRSIVTTPDRSSVSDFPSTEAAIVHLCGLIQQGRPHSHELFDQLMLGSEGSVSVAELQRLEGRVRIQEFWRRLCDAERASAEGSSKKDTKGDVDEVDGLEAAMEVGRDLAARCRKEQWTGEEKAMLDEAFGLLGTPPSGWGEAVMRQWRIRGERNAQIADGYFRRVNGLRPLSYLTHAIMQTRLISRALLDHHVPESTFVDIRRIWEDKEALRPAQKAFAASQMIAADGKEAGVSGTPDGKEGMKVEARVGPARATQSPVGVPRYDEDALRAML